MPKSYSFVGSDAVGAYVSSCLENAGWQRAGSASAADVALTYCVSASALEDAYFDEGGLVKTARKGALLIDLSACPPSLAREISAVATVNDLKFVEAPIVVRDPTRARALSPDNVECYVSSDDQDALEQAGGVLGALAGEVSEVGASGDAQLAKAACTSQIASTVLSAVESAALSWAVKGAGAAFQVPGMTQLSSRVLAAVEEERFEGDYTVEMLMGDVVAAMTAADDVDLIVPQLEAIMHLLEMLAVIGGADKSPAALSLLYRDEKASAQHGLDWTRAEGLFEDHADHHDHDAPGGYAGEYDEYDDGDFYVGGLGGYSAN